MTAPEAGSDGGEATARVAPLLPADLSPEQLAWLAPFTATDGRYPNIFGVLARHMRLLNAWTPFGLYTMRGSTLSRELREVLILRTAHNCRSDYERHQHRRIALRLGMTCAVLDRIDGEAPTGDPDHDLMIACADELSKMARIGDATWSAMSQRLGLEATLDAIFTVGAYTTIAMALNSCDVRIETDT